MNARNFAYRWRREVTGGILSGLLLAFSFPPYPLRYFSLIALVPLVWCVLKTSRSAESNDRFIRRGFIAFYLAGIVFFSILLYWIANVIPASKVTVRWVLAPGVAILVMYLSLFPGLAGLALAFLIKRYGERALLSLPALWSLSELIRSSWELAFSWGSLSNSLASQPLAIQALSIYGPYGFSFFIVLVNVLAAIILYSGSMKKGVAAFLFLALILSSHIIFGISRMGRYDASEDLGDARKKVAVVQPNVGLDIKWKPEYKDMIFSEIERLTSRFSSGRAELVVFPETSAPVALSRSARYRSWLSRTASSAGTDLLVGYIDHVFEDGEWRSYNTAGLFDSDGKLVQQYYKANLLPFGEKLPFSEYFPVLEKIDFGQANFKSGEENTVFESRGGKFGVLICFESTFPGYARRYVKRGADFLVNITNDGWFGSERGPLQHSETAIMRAVENGVFVLRAANTGVSMYIDPAGRVRSDLPLNTEGVIVCAVKPPAGPTPYVSYGDLFFNILVIISLAAVITRRNRI